MNGTPLTGILRQAQDERVGDVYFTLNLELELLRSYNNPIPVDYRVMMNLPVYPRS